MKIGFKKVHPDAVIPKYAHEGDAGMDVYAINDELISLNEPTIVKTGLVAEIPDGYEIQVRPRSGLATKGVTVFNTPGTIDSNYRGEIGVILYAVKGNVSFSGGSIDENGRYKNEEKKMFSINKGDRIAQLVVAPVTKCEPVEVLEVSETDRGTGGFGSTGV